MLEVIDPERRRLRIGHRAQMPGDLEMPRRCASSIAALSSARVMFM